MTDAATETVDLALDCVTRGWPLFPCQQDKTPKTAHGFKDACLDRARVTAWLIAGDGLGVDCGAAGLVVVDLDVKRSEQNGLHTWARLRQELGFDDSGALEQITPSGGKHLIFSDPTGGRLRNSAGKLGPGIDIRANGGYVLIAPSQAINSDGTTGVYRRRGDWNHAPAPLPDVIVERLLRPDLPRPAQPPSPPRNGHGQHSAYGARALQLEIEALLQTPEGQRNDQLNRAAFCLGQLVAGGELTEDEVEVELTIAAGRVGLTDQEIPRTIRSGLAAGALEPRTAPDQPRLRIVPPPSQRTTADNRTTAAVIDLPETVNERYVVHHFSEVFTPQEPLTWIISGLLPVDTVTMFVGEGGSKKTWAMFDMAVCVATGQDWLGMPTTPAPVLIIDEETGDWWMKNRLSQVGRGHVSTPPETPLHWITLAGFNYFKEQADADELEKLVRVYGAGLIIIDALADIMIGGDENAVQDIQPVFHRLRLVANRTHCAIVVIHHFNKNGSTRGSTAIKGAVDLILTAASTPDSPYINFACEKARNIQPPHFAARANFGLNTFNLTLVPAVNNERYSRAETYVLNYLADHGASDMNTIKGQADSCSESSARQAVFSLAARGKIRRIDAGGKGARATYDLIDNLSNSSRAGDEN